MAEYAVGFVLEKIGSYLIQQAGSFWVDMEVRDQIEWIEGELRRMQCFVKEADSEKDSDERVKNWVDEIRDVAYDTDDVVDSFLLRTEQANRRSGLIGFLKRKLLFNKMVSHHELNNRIKGIRSKIQEITDSRVTYGIGNIGKGRDGQTSFSAVSRLLEKRRSSPCVCEDIVGLDEDVRQIESKLLGGESGLSVISIVGMAGIGKTTLAKKVFLDCDIGKHFDCCAWVYVSQDYRAKDILIDLGKKLMGYIKEDLLSVKQEELMENISGFLEDKRYFVVLDDIWRSEVWYDLKAAFPKQKNGSRLMITTRFKDVALRADPRNPPHELSVMNDEDSWELFSMKVCSEWQSCTTLPPWSRELGKEILRRCGGLPLAIVVLGGLLSRKEATFKEWLKVLQSVHWQLRQDSMQCVEILALSYEDLPYYLKPCFLYFGLFPEDYEISARRLMLLWVAEGFVLPRGQEPLEDVAEDCLEELIGRSMAQVGKRNSNGRIKTCRIHDLLRELSMTKAKEDNFLHVIHGHSNANSLTRGRRLAIHSGELPISKHTQNVRTLLCFDLSETTFGPFKKFQLLRVMDLESIYLNQLDSSIGNLIHLRYLGLQGTWLKKLPSSIRYLMKLQTLDLRSTLISPIPLPIWDLKQLRNLYFNELEVMIVNPPAGNAVLPGLQTLRGICIGLKSQVENGLDRLISIRELELHGELILHETSLAKWISMANKLECLRLTATTMVDQVCGRNCWAIPESLVLASHFCLSKLHLEGFINKLYNVEEFPPNLMELSLQDSFLTEDPMPILEKLQNLRILKLKQSSYVGKEMVCSNGGFPQLHFLKLSFLGLKTLRIEEGGLAKLKQLEIIECKKLKIFPRGLHPVTSLRDLKLGYMPRDFESKVQDRKGENWYRIHHVLPI